MMRRASESHSYIKIAQVDQLRGENSSLYKQLTEISQQCESAAINNRVLKSDVEALRATVWFTIKHLSLVLPFSSL